MYEDIEDESTFYSYKFKRLGYKKAFNGKNKFVVGRIEVQSRITLEKYDMVFALLKFSGEDFHCTMKEFSDEADFARIQKDLIAIFKDNPITEIIRHMDAEFGSEYYTLKNIFLEERRKILTMLLKSKTNKFTQLYKEIYDEGKGSIYHYKSLGLDPPNEFKIATTYTLGREFNEYIEKSKDEININDIMSAIDINSEAKNIGIKLDKKYANSVFTEKITDAVFNVAKSPEVHRLEIALELFKYADLLDINPDITEAQNIYYNRMKELLDEFAESNSTARDDYDRKFILLLFDLGVRLNINTDFYKDKFDILMSPLNQSK